MRITFQLIILLYCFPFLLSCTEEERLNIDYPRIKTLDISVNTMEEVIYKAEITYRGETEIQSYGFVWGQGNNPDLISGSQVRLNGKPENNTFAITLNDLLIKNTTYTVRAFVETDQYVIYGQTIEFTSVCCN
jgi:hypothetical protein